MKKEIKNFFLTFIKLNKKGLILALLFFLVFGLIFPSQPTWAQIEGFSLNCGWADLFCAALEAFLSGILKIVILIFFGIPLLISALFVGIMSLILGWIISPDFISLKFTQNPFVNIGLSITKNFANMGFIIFLVAIALATALRIEEYKAKKTLITLILIALLVNFSPVLCGFIIDASNIVMNFFLNHVTGLLGFYNFVMGAAQALWNLIVTSGFNLWANISAAMQIIIMIVFNYFAGFIFILFSALFIMRYIMLWILVILSPIAFVSYILPITRRGKSLLSWRTWWEQLIAWSIIGIIAAFFLYLGFTMIAMINANPRQFVCLPGDQNCGPGGLGLMNNILPYLIPLVLLWIAYRETKKTTAMFAREIIEMPEKVAKGAVMAAAIAATGGAATVAAGKLKGAIGTLSSKTKFEDFAKTHKWTARLATPIAKPLQWGRGVEEKIAPAVKERVVEPIRERARRIEREHPEFAGYVRAAGRGLKESLWTGPKKTVTEGFRKAWEDWKTRTGLVIPLSIEKELERINELITKVEGGGVVTEEDIRGIKWAERDMERTGEVTLTRLRNRREVLERRIAHLRERKPPPTPPPTPLPATTPPTAPSPSREAELDSLYKDIQAHLGKGAAASLSLGEILKRSGLPSSFSVKKQKEPIAKGGLGAELSFDFWEEVRGEIEKIHDQKISESERKKILDQLAEKIKKELEEKKTEEKKPPGEKPPGDIGI